MTAASRFPGVTLKYCFERIGFTQLPYKLEFSGFAELTIDN